MNSTDMDLGALLFAVIFAGALAYGLHQRRMPLRWFDLDCARNPAGFWVAAAAFAGASLLFFLMAFNPEMR